jgi:hypothetical protein
VPIYNPPGGGANVTKAGTPANNQVGVWTGDGTIEGDADLTFDSTTLTVTGNAQVTGTMAVGNSASVSADYGLYNRHEFTGTGVKTGLTAFAGYTPSIDNQVFYGLWMQANSRGTNNIGSFFGTYTASYHGSSGTASQLYGMYTNAVALNSSGKVTTQYGIYNVNEIWGTGSVGTNYDLYLDTLWGTGIANVENNYALYIADHSGQGSVSSYNIYSAGATAKNHFAGNVTVGDALTVADEAYGVGWNSSLEVPTKNALYDKIETLVAGSGDVTKVGTPVNNQVGVWTGDGTIEGDAKLTFDGALNVTTSVLNQPLAVFRSTNTTSSAPAAIFLTSFESSVLTNVSLENQAGGLNFRTGATTVSDYGTIRMRIFSSGNVGIKVDTVPSEHLTINGTFGLSGDGTAGTGYVGFDYDGTADALRFRTNVGGVLLNTTHATLQRVSGRFGLGVTPTSVLHLKAGTATANTAPFQMDSGTYETTARAGVMEYNGRFAVTESDAARRYVVQAAASTKTTAGAPHTSDGYVTLTINGTDVKVMTTAG